MLLSMGLVLIVQISKECRHRLYEQGPPAMFDTVWAWVQISIMNRVVICANLNHD